MAYATKEKQQAAVRAYHLAHREDRLMSMRQRYQAHRAESLTAQREYHEQHRAERLARMRLYNEAHQEEGRAACRAYYQLHRSLLIDKVLKYQREHPEMMHAKKARRRAQQAHSPLNDFTADQWKELKAVWRFQCAYCGKTPVKLSQDHVLPLSKGGLHTASNIVPACISCNSKKHIGPPLRPVQPVLLTISLPKPFTVKGSSNA